MLDAVQLQQRGMRRFGHSPRNYMRIIALGNDIWFCKHTDHRIFLILIILS